MLKKKNEVKELMSFKLLKEFIGVYLAFFFLLFPLYYEQKYLHIGDVKWKIFRNFTIYINFFGKAIPTALGIMVVLFLLHMKALGKTGERGKFWKSVSKTDICVLTYFVVCFIATLLTPFKKNVFMGTGGWYCGFIFQMAIVLLYFFISRYWRWDDIMFMAYLSVSAVVYLLAVLQRFSIDPFKFYVGITDTEKTSFLSTIGQNTWYSSYLVIVFPIGLFAYWYVKKKAYRIATLLYLILGAMTIVTQDSDSTFFALFAIYFVLFAVSFRANECMIRFFESLVVILTTWRVVGFMQLIFADSVLTTRELMLFFSKSNLMWIPWAVSVVIYVLLRKLDKDHKLDVTKYKWIVKVLTGAAVLGVAVLVIYIVLNTTGALPEGMRSSGNYLLFNDYWGNYRGFNWKMAVNTYLNQSKDYPWMALIGGGPDTYMESNTLYFVEQIKAFFGSYTIQSAHNEFLTELVWGGILGLAAYIGVFVTAMVRYYKKSVKNPELIAVVMAIAGYVAHNFFCYQQVVCTPMIFIIIGMGECIARMGELRLISDGG